MTPSLDGKHKILTFSAVRLEREREKRERERKRKREDQEYFAALLQKILASTCMVSYHVEKLRSLI